MDLDLNKINVFKEEWFSLPEVYVKYSEEFVRSNNSIGMYLRKRNANLGRVKQQLLEGKLGEFAAYIFLSKLGFPESILPDTQIYSVKQKTWEPDLPYSRSCAGKFPDVTVKTCTLDSATKYEESYIFQITDKLFDEQKSCLVCLVLYDTEQAKFCVRALLPIETLLKKNLFKNPKLEKHIGSKVCIYYKDICVLGEN